MRRVGKQIVAITLAAAMMGSLTPEACTFLQNEIVYAAETNEASAPTVTRTELYKNENAKTTETIDFSGLQEEDWNGAGKITFAYDNSINGNPYCCSIPILIPVLLHPGYSDALYLHPATDRMFHPVAAEGFFYESWGELFS